MRACRCQVDPAKAAQESVSVGYLLVADDHVVVLFWLDVMDWNLDHVDRLAVLSMGFQVSTRRRSKVKLGRPRLDRSALKLLHLDSL